MAPFRGSNNSLKIGGNSPKVTPAVKWRVKAHLIDSKSTAGSEEEGPKNLN